MTTIEKSMVKRKREKKRGGEKSKKPKAEV